VSELKRSAKQFMPACHIAPANMRKLVSDVGEELVRTHGKKKYYPAKDVERAARNRGYAVDVHCWAYCFYTSPEDFKALHDAAGEICDYVAMKAEILKDISSGSFLPGDIDLSWLEWPDIDLSAIFDWFDFSP
jgi:hypothetical protein